MPLEYGGRDMKIVNKIKEIGETPVPLKHVVLIVTFAVLVVRPPIVWKYGYFTRMAVSSQELHRV